MAKLAAFVKGHMGAALAATAATVVLVGGIILILVVGGGGATSVSTSGTTSTTVAPARRGAGGGAAQRQGVRGEITAISGNTWTVRTAAGASVSVIVSPSTTFGTPANPASAADFSVGDRIVVLGARSGTTVTATRIAKAGNGGGRRATTTVPSG